LNTTNQLPPPVPPPTSPAFAPPVQMGLAIASLVLGVLAVLASLFLVGALFGLVGLVLGMVHLSRRTGRNGLAWAGMVLSVIGVFASIGLILVYYPFVKEAIKLSRQMQGSGSTETGFEKWEGVIAPDFSVKTLDGQTVKLSELKGKRVVLDFWATWCPPCVKEVPRFIRLRRDVPESNLVILGVSKEDADTLRSFVKEKRVNYLIASADNLPSPYRDVTGIPTTFFIDRRGAIQKVAVGYHDFDALKAMALAADDIREPKQKPDAPGPPPSAAGQ